jgi:hypothetical protein
MSRGCLKSDLSLSFLSSILNVIDKITRSNFSNSFKRPQFVKLCTIIKPVTF